MALASGLAASLGFKEETTWGTAVTVDRWSPFVSESVKQDIAKLESAGIISGARVMRSQQWANGKTTVGGDIGLEVYDRTIGLLMKHAMGSVSSSGTTAPFTHTFTPGDLTGLGLTMQVGRPDRGGTVRPFTYAGVKIASWELAAAAGEIATLGLTVAAKSETDQTALTAVSIGTSIAPMNFVGGSFSLAGSSLCVRNVKIAGDNGLDVDRRCGGQAYIDQPLEANLRKYTGEVTLEFPDLYHYDRFVAGTEGALVFAVAKGTSSLTVNANVRTDGTTPNVSGPGIITHTLNFSCVATNTNDGSALNMVFVTSDTTP